MPPSMPRALPRAALPGFPERTDDVRCPPRPNSCPPWHPLRLGDGCANLLHHALHRGRDGVARGVSRSAARGIWLGNWGDFRTAGPALRALWPDRPLRRGLDSALWRPWRGHHGRAVDPLGAWPVGADDQSLATVADLGNPAGLCRGYDGDGAGGNRGEPVVHRAARLGDGSAHGGKRDRATDHVADRRDLGGRIWLAHGVAACGRHARGGFGADAPVQRRSPQRHQPCPLR